MIPLSDLTYSELTAELRRFDISSFYADKVWRGMYQELVTDISDFRGISDQVRSVLEENFALSRQTLLSKQRSSDGLTQKYLLGLADGQAIETVIMAYTGRRDRPEESRRFTACISSQAGCAMGCVFCATGQMGFGRHLSPGEIVGQLVFAQQQLASFGHKLRNVVLMGMGEPLHNYENVTRALKIITDPKGLALGPRHITLSTVGLPDGIRRLADESIPINLAVSLHGATDQARSALVPPANKWPLGDLLDACREYTLKKQRRIFFEWALIDQKNDTVEDAHQLGALLVDLNAHVNVIPLNPTGGYSGRPSDPHRVKAFQTVLHAYGIPSTVRQRRGIDIAAGCGQLAVDHLRI